jgi:3'(2'),5'-bisphosphate nucleotidase
MQDDDALAEIFAFLALKAGAAIMRVRASGARARIKSDSSPVCDADLLAEEIILEGLVRLAPRFPIVAEELCASGGTPEIDGGPFFLVDPLDGTREFIQKRTDFTINVALIEDGAPAFGLVYAPARSLLALTLEGAAYEAELMPSEHGANLDGLRLHKIEARAPSPDGLVAVVSLSHLDAATEAFLGTLKIAGKSSAGSSLKFLQVARGDADVYPRFGPTMEWDTAAGHAVLLAAGGSVIAADGGQLRYGKSESGLRNAGFIAWGSGPHP